MTINCKGILIDLSSPKIMGILNCTPDSFYDGGKYKNKTEILHQVEKMLSDGATFIDIGAYSSRPGAKHISETEELARLLPVLELVLEAFPDCIISADTFRSTIAEKAIAHGAALINDISAGSMDDNMLATIAKLQVPYIMMHMKGTPQNMQKKTKYKDILLEINTYFAKKVAAARALQIHDLIIDPGFGFSKTLAHNFELLNNMDLLQMQELPILVGLSRKSMIYKTLNTAASEALNGTSILNTVALQKGATILRVHDVKEAKQCVQLMAQLDKK